MLQDRVLATIDEAQLKSKVLRWQEKIMHHHELLKEQRLN